ncbi:hypothetical protein Tsubulata_040664 [Turnera subulata]|uniref:RING-type domain-containing protein n=1 Tax=Turnera subulata TaxID=218843 RepID=A0A9Q0G6K6_9ROSI|nr:hypothetical protein Tsubulata_040664 [Turnera subulata]
MILDMDFVTSELLEEETVEFGENNDVSSFEGERCGICMDIVIDRGVLDSCDHWFCFACIDNWSTITNLCPLCQSEFQLITCVPVYDTVGSSKAKDESFFGEDDWSIEGKSNSLSFPSYYIDENAVICLDGDSCKVRSGSATMEEESVLDTSIACDSCDIWYHAFCVGFDPEGTCEDTWLCPRCIADEALQKSDASSIQGPNNQYGPESSLVNYFNEDVSSEKMSISVADAGETAIIVSMIGENKWIDEPSKNFHPALEVDRDLKVDTINADGNSLTSETPSCEEIDVQPILEKRNLELSLSCVTSISQPTNALEFGELRKASCGLEGMNEPSSSDGVQSSSFHSGNELTESKSSMGLHLGLTMGCSLPGDHLKNKGTEDQVTRDVQLQSHPEKPLVKDEKILPVANGGPVNSLVSKRKHADCSDDAADGGESKVKNEAGVLTKKSRIVQMTPRDQDYVLLSDSSRKCLSQIAVQKDMTLKQSPGKNDNSTDIMSIVKGIGRRPAKGVGRQSPADKSSKEKENAAGLRVKKIMRRGPIEDQESSIVVEKLRKEIREAVRNRVSSEIGENLFDPKLLAAFRRAIAGNPTEQPVMKMPPSALKAKKSMLQKGKVRENLTKKIYGDSNGRRKRAWDRDCEVEFWKHRCMRATKPEKVATLKSVLNLLRTNPEGSEVAQAYESKEKNPILSRLYLADTSVFPRKDDIKPLSALAAPNNAEVISAQHVSLGKGQKSSLDEHAPKSAEANKASSKLGIPAVQDKGVKDKISGSKGKPATAKSYPGAGSEGTQVAPSGGSKINSQKETVVQSDDKKIDKRKWALEILARKKAAECKSGAHGKQGDNATLKGKYPLLAQLPAEMKPALAESRQNKIPISVRQNQLYRLAELFLRKLNLPKICRTAETELAIADAINIEKEVADKSNSKLVYMNLCSQEILHRSDNSQSTRTAEANNTVLSTTSVDGSKQGSGGLATDAVVIDALRNAGLLSDSPPSSPRHKSEVPNEVQDSQTQSKESEPDNVFEMDSHPEEDIYGDFEYDIEDEDYIGTANIRVSSLVPEEGESRMKVVFSTPKPESLNIAQDLGQCSRLMNSEEPKDSPSLSRSHIDAGIITSTMEVGADKSVVCTESLPSEEGDELSLAECEELYGPDKEPLINKFPEEASKKLHGLVDNEAPADGKTPGEDQIYETTRAVSIGHTGNGENSPNHSEISEKVPRTDKSRTDTDNPGEIANSVSKKVEAYIKEHIRPLCKSGIITPEQYRWTVAKTTDKVMKYHLNAKNANFLIKEGEKVKKLAEQYVEAAQKKEKSDPS